jgi:hypothetical protein
MEDESPRLVSYFQCTGFDRHGGYELKDEVNALLGQ